MQEQAPIRVWRLPNGNAALADPANNPDLRGMDYEEALELVTVVGRIMKAFPGTIIVECVEKPPGE